MRNAQRVGIGPNFERLRSKHVATRFATARALFETFPRSVTKIAVAATDESPILFLKKLSTQHKFEDAITFCAYLAASPGGGLVGVRMCQGAVSGILPASRVAAIIAAEAWVSEPDDERRRTALEIGNQGR